MFFHTHLGGMEAENVDNEKSAGMVESSDSHCMPKLLMAYGSSDSVVREYNYSPGFDSSSISDFSVNSFFFLQN